MGQDDLIRLDSVTKTYQAGAPPALADLSMDVTTGEVAAVMGPSGSGKSTLLNMIAGLDGLTAGTVTVAGRRIDNLGESGLARSRARHVGIIFQFFNLLDDLTVEDNVLLPAQLAGASRRVARARAGELLERMGIERHRDDYPARLSGGQRQRVAIARALVNAPELLLADEPTGALDTATGLQIGRLLQQLNAGGQTLGLVTHDPALADRYAARTIRLLDGRLAPAGAAAWTCLGPDGTAPGGHPRTSSRRGAALGSTITVTGVPGTPPLVVVGFGNSVTNTADGWVTPAEVTRLHAPGVPQSTQMLYRFTHAASYGEVRADVAEVSRALPPGAVTGAASWLAAQDQATGNGAIMEPFVVAFALIGLARAVLIVGNGGSGAGAASYARVGARECSGLSPAHALVACLRRGATCAGLARTGVTLAALAFGATAVIFAFGLSSSLSRAAASQPHSATIPVQVEPFGPGGGPGQMPTAAQDAAVPAALRAQPGTRHEVTLYRNGVKVPAIAGTVNAAAFRGAASWTGSASNPGPWYDAPG